jgi:hypothetical protein
MNKGPVNMNELSGLFNDRDLQLVVQVLMPEYKDRKRMIRILKSDEDILEGMLKDDKLFKYIMDDPESIIKISPNLLFTVLLNRVKCNLENQSYTVERQDRHQVLIFDSKEVVDLLHDKRILRYLADLMVSFVRINSYSVHIRVKRGVWRKFRFSDFDIDSLIRYSQMIEADRRFQSYKRIADICLFVTGVFPDYINTFRKQSTLRLGVAAQKRREEFAEHGRYFYRAASRQRTAQILELNDVLLQLSENFTLATKPLTLMTSRYLGFIKEKLFLQ